MKKKRKKQPWEIVLYDRFLTNEKPENPYVVAFLYFIVIFMSLMLVFVVFFQLCQVIGPSMENSLADGDHVLLFRNTQEFKHEDVVVITRGEGNDKFNIIKRVIAVEGDSLKFVLNGDVVEVYRKNKGSADFMRLNESYLKEPMKNMNFTGKYKPDGQPFDIAEGHLFVMGDNRNDSLDSRGPDGQYTVPSVLGKVFIKIDKGSPLEAFLKFLYHEDNAPAR